MIGKKDLLKAKDTCPPYLKRLVCLCINLYDHIDYMNTQGDFVTSSEIAHLNRLIEVILSEYLGIMSQFKSQDKELMKGIRNDIATVLSPLYMTQGGKLIKKDWNSMTEDRRVSFFWQVSSSVISFVESRICYPILDTVVQFNKEDMFLGSMVEKSSRKAEFYPDLKEKPKVADLFGGGDEDEEKTKKKKKKKDGEEE